MLKVRTSLEWSQSLQHTGTDGYREPSCWLPAWLYTPWMTQEAISDGEVKADKKRNTVKIRQYHFVCFWPRCLFLFFWDDMLCFSLKKTTFSPFCYPQQEKVSGSTKKYAIQQKLLVFKLPSASIQKQRFLFVFYAHQNLWLFQPWFTISRRRKTLCFCCCFFDNSSRIPLLQSKLSRAMHCEHFLVHI